MGEASWADVFVILFRSSGVQRDTLMEAFRDSADSVTGEERDDPLARMIHECFCCNCGFAVATRLSAGGLAARSVDILLKDAFPPHDSVRQDTAGSPPRRRPQAWLDLFVEPRTSLRDSARLRRTVMHHAN